MINKKTTNLTGLFIAASFLAVVMGCSSTAPNNTQNVNTATPQNTAAAEPAAQVNPTAAIAGAWETKYDIAKIIPGYPSSNLGTGSEFAQWRLSEGVKKGDEYVGKVTNELNNENIAEYSVNSNTITLKFLPVAGMQNTSTTQTAGTSRDYIFELSADGNTLTLKGNDPIMLTKGSNNADIELVSFVISNKVDWMLSSPKVMDHSKPMAHYVTFETAQKFDNGYTGKIEFWNEDPHNPTVPHTVVASGQYTLSSKDKMTITIGGSKSATYKLLKNTVLDIDFTDPNEDDLLLTAR